VRWTLWVVADCSHQDDICGIIGQLAVRCDICAGARASDARGGDSCTIAVDVRRETVLIHCDVFGAVITGMDGERMEEEALRDRAAARRRRA